MPYLPVVWLGLFFSFFFFLLLFLMVVWMLSESVTAWFVSFNAKNQLNLVKIYTATCKPDTSLYHIKSPDTHFSSHYAAELDYNIWFILLPYHIHDLMSFRQPLLLLQDTVPPLPLSLQLSFIKIPSSGLHWTIPAQPDCFTLGKSVLEIHQILPMSQTAAVLPLGSKLSGKGPYGERA